MKRKLIFCVSLTLVLSLTSISAFAQSNNTISTTPTEYQTALEKIENVLYQDKTADKVALSYMEEAVGQDDMMKVINNYENAYSKQAAYKMVAETLKSTYEEVRTNNFSEDQAKALFVSAANLEAGITKVSEMEFSSEIPDFAPTHPEMANDAKDIGEKSNSDRSTRTSYETGGIGYEVLSTSGYNKSTAFMNAGSCNITAPEGKAGYMFYTIYSNKHYQDVGIGYFGGKWQAFVSGYWTNWGTGTVSIKSGDYLYLKLWIGTDSRIYFQIFDGNNFNNIIFQNSYTTASSPIPPSGNGVNFNRQITLVDTAHNATSGLYLLNASFSQSHIYNNNVTQIFSDSNTNASRRGKFGCSWAADSKVTINSNPHWDSENITIKMQ